MQMNGGKLVSVVLIMQSETDVGSELPEPLTSFDVTPPGLVANNNNNVHLSCAHQRPERSHDTY